MNYQKLKDQWLLEEAASFKGWDFSRIDKRRKIESVPWDYKEIVSQYLTDTHTLLDMGTGGGEFLLSLNHPYKLTCVTEGYPPNVELCMKTLEPLGICVKQVYDDNRIPFDDETFDIVINRHEDFDINEVKRILKKGGVFITQQVGGQNSRQLREALNPSGLNNFEGHTLKNNLALVKNAGLEILFCDECFMADYFFDIGAIVYMAKIIEWEFPEFSVESCFAQLCKLQEQLNEKGFIKNSAHRFFIAAKKF